MGTREEADRRKAPREAEPPAVAMGMGLVR